ncbi:MAG: hypothetical protein DI601_14650 [Azospirillum brasilense]|nr:MAG: hypothetical protein DI601_14650 [Azospirillum brasilense]
MAFQFHKLDGEVLLTQPVSTQILIAVGGLIVLGALCFLATASHARMERVAGWVVPQGGLIRVAARQGGLLESVLVPEGEEVRKGDRIAALHLPSILDAGGLGQTPARQLEMQLAEQVRSSNCR